MERSGYSVAMLLDNKVGRNGPLELMSSSSGPLSHQVFKTLPKCYPFINFARFNTILIPKHTSILKATCLQGATTPLSLSPQFLVNYTFKHEAREVYTNRDKRYV